MVDLDEVERDWKEHGSIYEHAPAIIAELREARELIALVRHLESLGLGRVHLEMSVALDAYDKVVKGGE